MKVGFVWAPWCEVCEKRMAVSIEDIFLEKEVKSPGFSSTESSHWEVFCKKVFWRYPPGKFDLFWTALTPVKNRLFWCYFTFLGNTRLFWCNSTFLEKTQLFWSYTTFLSILAVLKKLACLASWENGPALKMVHLPGNFWAVLQMERLPGIMELFSEQLPPGKTIGVRT